MVRKVLDDDMLDAFDTGMYDANGRIGKEEGSDAKNLGEAKAILAGDKDPSELKNRTAVEVVKDKIRDIQKGGGRQKELTDEKGGGFAAAVRKHPVVIPVALALAALGGGYLVGSAMSSNGGYVEQGRILTVESKVPAYQEFDSKLSDRVTLIENQMSSMSLETPSAGTRVWYDVSMLTMAEQVKTATTVLDPIFDALLKTSGVDLDDLAAYMSDPDAFDKEEASVLYKVSSNVSLTGSLTKGAGGGVSTQFVGSSPGTELETGVGKAAPVVVSFMGAVPVEVDIDDAGSSAGSADAVTVLKASADRVYLAAVPVVDADGRYFDAMYVVALNRNDAVVYMEYIGLLVSDVGMSAAYNNATAFDLSTLQLDEDDVATVAAVVDDGGGDGEDDQPVDEADPVDPRGIYEYGATYIAMLTGEDGAATPVEVRVSDFFVSGDTQLVILEDSSGTLYPMGYDDMAAVASSSVNNKS